MRPKEPWKIEKVPETKLEGLLNAIVGFSVDLETLEGKFKLSQDKKPEDFDGVVGALEALREAGAKAVAAAMLRYSLHRKSRGLYPRKSAAAKSAAGAFSSQLGTSSGMSIPFIFRFVQMWATMPSSSLRSSVPARTTASPGRALFVL